MIFNRPMPAAYAALQFKVFKVSGEVGCLRTSKIKRLLELLAILVFTLAAPLAIWKGTGQKAVISLVAAVIFLLRPDRVISRAISLAGISKKARSMLGLSQRRKKGRLCSKRRRNNCK